MAEIAGTFGTGALRRLILSQSLPTLLSALGTAAYSIVDAGFVARLGTPALAALALSFPLFALFGAAGLTIGTGTASAVSRALGRGDLGEADEKGLVAVRSSLLLGFLLAGVTVPTMSFVTGLLGATGENAPLATVYCRIVVAFMPVALTNIIVASLARAEGRASLATIAMAAGIAVNGLLAYLLIFSFRWGIEGAAWATAAGQTATLGIYVGAWRSLAGRLVRSMTGLASIRGIATLAAGGIPALAGQLSLTVLLVGLNEILGRSGSVEVAALGLSVRLLGFGMLVVLGFAQGLQPIVGYNYGAGLRDRSARAGGTVAAWTTAFSALYAGTLALWAPNIMGLLAADPHVARTGALFLRATMALFWLFGAEAVVILSLQAIGSVRQAAIASAARLGPLHVAILLPAAALFGARGVVYGYPAADIAAAAVCGVCAVGLVRNLRGVGR